ncbi:hypothetical protein CEY11_10020 [Candidimonas nitroreducens]|uniref:Uncharacterized protein n=2 Tax=Candidimonas nitroreducens TaxID=683354 RepID=A0A225MKZ1_9BURK|nr:hypothetical protein CEY11_10020 [Candidimonas nitroreducens]
MRRLVRTGDWRAGLASFKDARSAGAPPDASARLLCAIARLRLADGDGAVAARQAGAVGGAGHGVQDDRIDAALVKEAGGRVDMRRLAIAPLIRKGELARAVPLLRVLVQAYRDIADDRRTLASVLGRLKCWDEAVECADEAAAIAPMDPDLQGARIQLRLLASRELDAAAVARDTAGLAAADLPNAHLWLAALLRGGQAGAAAGMAAGFDATQFANERVAAAAVQALAADRRIGAAIDAGEAALAAGLDGAALRMHLGLAHLERGYVADKAARAQLHFTEGVRLSPEHLRLNALQGETLLRTGRYVDALAPLSKACELAPGLVQARSLYARALRYAGRHADAADQALKLVEAAPDSPRWQRSAAAALVQAGRVDQAGRLFDRYLRGRADRLPGTFAQALRELEGRVDDASTLSAIPLARLDWAWSLRRGQDGVDREQWERAARWGYLADQLILEWLECRQGREEEAMEVLDGLDELEAFLQPFLEDGRGMVVATAHVGPMYAGLMVLELLGVPSRWISSTPSIAGTSYASALISTADKSDPQVGRAMLRALADGYAVCLAVDGAPNPAAPRIVFEGQEITYSSFAARAAHRLGLPSMFYAPRWVNGRVVHSVQALPEAQPGENVEAYALRWQEAYLQLLREHLAGSPENLRLSGGIWRHVRAPEKG